MGTKATTTYLRRVHTVMYGGVRNDVNEVIPMLRTRTGNELPNHRAVIFGRKDATTALSASEMTGSYTPGGFLGRQAWPAADVIDTKTGFQFSQMALPQVSHNDQAVAVAKCTSKFYGRLNDLRKPLQGQAMIGELRQTIRLLRNPFKTGVGLLESVFNRKGKLITKNIGNVWLELRFGLLPLMSEVQDIMAILRQKAQREQLDNFRCYGVAEGRNVTNGTASSIYGLNYATSTVRTTKAEYIIRFGYLTQLLDEHEAMVAKFQASFADIRDIPGTAWELTPWSFLIDYFVNIGQIIEAATTSTEGVIYTSKSLILTTTLDHTVQFMLSVPGGVTVRRFTPVQLSLKLRTVSRATGPVGIPPIAFTLPRSDIRLANIAALLTGFLKGK